MKRNCFEKTVTRIVLSILAGALSISAQENPEIAPRALPARPGMAGTLRVL